jgi:hypothetical protein
MVRALQMIAPALNELADEYADRRKIEKST